MSDLGGAGRAAFRLHQGLLEIGEKSHVLCRESQCHEPNVSVYAMSDFRRRFMTAWRYNTALFDAWRIERQNHRFAGFSFPFSPFSLEHHALVHSADIIHLHWVAYFLNYPTFFRRVHKPIVWTLHDQNPLLGGFMYALDQDRLQLPLDARLKARKAAWIQHATNLHVVATNQWMKSHASESLAFQGRPCHCIPNGVDLSVFRPYPRDAARTRFGLPLDKRILLYVVDTQANAVYKGADILVATLPALTRQNLCVCGIGSFPNDTGCEIRSLLRQKNPHDLAELYSAVDFLIVPTREDTGPNTMLESMACGTPVIGTPIGGLRDFIRDGETGILCKDVSSDALCHAVEIALKHTFDRDHIRRFAEANFSLEQQARAYCEVYREALNHHD